MKLVQTIILTAILSIPAMALQATEGTESAASRFSVELGYTMNLAEKEIVRDCDISGVRIHTAGPDLTGVYALGNSRRHALTLRLAYAEGEVSDSSIIGSGVYEIEGKLRSFSIMPGYRYTRDLYGKLGFYAGANIGLLCHNAEDHEKWGDDVWVDVKNYAYGFAYSAELGLTWKAGRHLSYFVAYQFSGSTARPKLEWNDGETTFSSRLNGQTYHSIRCGLSFRF